MKSIISKTMTLVAIGATLLSFSPKFGGEGFEISLNGKVVLQRDCFGSGNTVILFHGLGLYTTYFHHIRNAVIISI